MENSEQLIAIAKRFSHALRMALPPGAIDVINEKNCNYPDSPCASHDFTDANRMMGTAFNAVVGRLPASHLQEDALLWHDAWQLARLSGFDNTADVDRLASLCPNGETLTVTQLKSRYPQLEEWPTGGGCIALRLEFPDGSYLLLTDLDDGRLPSADSVAVRTGLYANQGDSLSDVAKLPVSQVQAMIDFRTARVSDPKTVYDYFVKEIRAAPGEYLSLTLPLTSRRGAICAEAIDLASCLISHIHSSSNIIENYRDSDRIVAITRRILDNYING